jgi:hypothetical protein
MRVPLFACVMLLALAPSSLADKGGKAGAEVMGTFEVRYEEVSSNCSQTSITMTRGTLGISKKGKQLVVDIERFPYMYGSPGKAGKVRASSKIAPSSIEGVDGKFSVAGRVDEGLIELVFVAEYYVNNKPLCSQSWNVTGQKQNESKGKGGKVKSAMIDGWLIPLA